MAKTDGACCNKCGKYLTFQELRWVLGYGFYLCLDCMPEPKPKPRLRAVPPAYQTCTECGRAMPGDEPRTIRYDPRTRFDADVVYCRTCVRWYDDLPSEPAEPCAENVCAICTHDCADDEPCGTITNGDRTEHVCSRCYDVWAYIRDMAAESSDRSNEPRAVQPPAVGSDERRIGKAIDDMLKGSGDK